MIYENEFLSHFDCEFMMELFTSQVTLLGLLFTLRYSKKFNEINIHNFFVT